MTDIIIIGRSNVGKSALFNLLSNSKKAIVNDEENLTRDKQRTTGVLFESRFNIIDTPGISYNHSLSELMNRNVRFSAAEADIIFFMIDGTCGITNDDMRVFNEVKAFRKKIILVVNKCDDGPVYEHNLRLLGIDEVFYISVIRKRGFEELHDYLVKQGVKYEKTNKDVFMRLAIIGKPNVGKSSYINTLMNVQHNKKNNLRNHSKNQSKINIHDEFLHRLENSNLVNDNINNEDNVDEAIGRIIDKNIDIRGIVAENHAENDEISVDKVVDQVMDKDLNKSVDKAIDENGIQNISNGNVVSAIPGTTRDAIEQIWQYKGNNILLTDTAGIYKNKSQNYIDKISVKCTEAVIKYANVVILVVDAEVLFGKNDWKILNHAVEEGRGVIIIVNKCDLVDTEILNNKLTSSLKNNSIYDIPIFYVSVKKRKNIFAPVNKALQVFQMWQTKISTSNLNKWLKVASDNKKHRLIDGKAVNFKYVTQVYMKPITCKIFCNVKPNDKNYISYLSTHFGRYFNLSGFAIRFIFVSQDTKKGSARVQAVKDEDGLNNSPSAKSGAKNRSMVKGIVSNKKSKTKKSIKRVKKKGYRNSKR